MTKPVLVTKNILWSLLDETSQLYIISLLLKNGFAGETKLTSEVSGNTTIIIVKDEYNHEMELPIDILNILNN